MTGTHSHTLTKIDPMLALNFREAAVRQNLRTTFTDCI